MEDDSNMKRNDVVKGMTVLTLAAALAFTMAGCVKSVSASAFKTVNGVTEGNYEVSTDDKGSASFNIEGNHVEMTNFTFDADAALKVEADILEDELVYTQVLVHDDEQIMQNIADGHYREALTQENAAKEFNTLYQTVFDASDEPVIDDIIDLNQGVLVAQLQLTDAQLFMLAKDGTDQFIMVAATTEEYGSQEIIDAAFDALKDESAPATEEEAAEEETAEAAGQEEGYPVYSHATDDPYYLPACQYIMENYGTSFDQYDIMLPYVNILRVDDSDPEDIKVWGNFQVFNYVKRGTTLMMRNGGDFSGMIHMKKDGDSYVGTSMDMVESGSENGPSIERIFGVDDELMEAFRQSNEEGADQETILNTIRWYSEDTGIELAAYEDFGWDPVYIDPDAAPELEYPDLEGEWVTDGARMEIHNPKENDGSVYEAIILVDQEDGSTIEFAVYGQYEFSTGALYYWDGWVTEKNGDEEEELGNNAVGYLGLEEDGTIVWYSANHESEIWFERA